VGSRPVLSSRACNGLGVAVDQRNDFPVGHALVPDMSYDGMEVAESNDAGLAWEKMVRAEAGSAERRRLTDALMAYCKQDTLAMVKLLEVLYNHSA